MSQPTVMFATPSSHEIGPIETRKIADVTMALDAELELFRCIFQPGAGHSGVSTPADVREEIHQHVVREQHALEWAAEPFRTRGLNVRTSVRWDFPAYEGIVRQALRHKPALLIAESLRRGRAERFVLPHLDWKLIETCPCPLLLLKTRRPYTEPLVLAAVDPGHRHDKPAALDEGILDLATRMSEALSGRLVVFHARRPWDDVSREEPELRDAAEYREEDIHQNYLARIETQVTELAQRHAIDARHVHLEDGPAAEALARYANEQKADILVMGAISRSWLRRAVIGHTAERVLDAVASDVLIVKPPQFHSPVRRQSMHHVESTPTPGLRMTW